MSETKAEGCGCVDCVSERALKWAQIDLAAARHERDKLRAERDEARRATQAAQEDNRKLCLEAAQAAGERDRLAARLVETKADRDVLASRVWKLRCEQAELKSERDGLAGKVAGLTQDVELMRAARDAVAADRDRVLARANASKLALAGKIDELREQLRAREEHAAVLQRKLGDAKGELEELRKAGADAAIYIIEDGPNGPGGQITRVPLVEAQAAWLELRALKAATAASAAPLLSWPEGEPAPKSVGPDTPAGGYLGPARFIEGKLRRTAGPTVTVRGRDGMGCLATDAESVTITF